METGFLSDHNRDVSPVEGVTRRTGMALGEVHTETSGSYPGIPIITAAGEVDLAIAPTMETHISDALEQNSDLIIDLSGASFIDSVALGVLTWALERTDNTGHRLFLVADDPRVLRVFELTGLTASFSIFDSRVALSTHLSQADTPS
jgi:anti-anti-sigma factor